MSLLVRDLRLDDLEAIAAIYARHVRDGLATFEEVPPGAAIMAERAAAIARHGLPYLVAEHGDMLVGYAYAAPFRDRSAYRFTIEDSIYVAAGEGRRGVGLALLRALIARCEQGPWRQMVAVIGDSGNAGSVGLHARCGFAHVGIQPAVGFKHGRWVDSVLMQRALGDGAASLP